MERRTVTIPNIGCDGCVNTIKSELSALDSVIFVSGSVDDKTITLDYDGPLAWQQVVKKLNEIDYAPVEA